MKKIRLGVLVSGSGSNLQAILDACREPGYPAEVAVVLSNNPEAFALARAQKAGVAAQVVNHREHTGRLAFEEKMVEVLSPHNLDLICLAGFMRLLSRPFLNAFPNVLNIHPALLPAFPGLHAPRQALAHGVKITGCTVHFVDEGTDTGPILAQAAVPILPDDDEASLSARIQAEEHKLYPLAIRLVAEGAYQRQGQTIKIQRVPAVAGLSLQNPGK